MKKNYPVTRAPRKILFTEEGYKKIQSEFKRLTEKRKTAVVSLTTARDMGDLSENGAYKAARFQLSDIDRQLRWLKYQIRFGVITPTFHTGMVGFGNQVTLTNNTKTMTFMLVDGFESNPVEKKLSVHSPIGRAVVGKKIGDTVIVTAPAGQLEYKITKLD